MSLLEYLNEIQVMFEHITDNKHVFNSEYEILNRLEGSDNTELFEEIDSYFSKLSAIHQKLFIRRYKYMSYCEKVEELKTSYTQPNYKETFKKLYNCIINLHTKVTKYFNQMCNHAILFLPLIIKVDQECLVISKLKRIKKYKTNKKKN